MIRSTAVSSAVLIPACRSEEKALEAIENITFELEAAAGAIRHNKNTKIKGQVRHLL